MIERGRMAAEANSNGLGNEDPAQGQVADKNWVIDENGYLVEG